MSILAGYSPIFQHVEPIRYALDKERGLILEEWRGRVTVEILRTHWIQFLAHDEVMGCRRTVVDISESTIEMKGADFFGLIQSLVTPALRGKSWITAIIVRSDYQYGVSRQYGIYADVYSQDQIFKNPADAFAWIANTKHAP